MYQMTTNFSLQTLLPALSYAAAMGDLDDVVALLADSADVNGVPTGDAFKGMTALMWAVKENHLPVVRKLLAAGADIYAKCYYGITATETACHKGDVSMVMTLICSSSSRMLLDDCSLEAQKFLKIACEFGHLDLVRTLIDTLGGGLPRTAGGVEALGRASLCGHLEIVRLMLERGASANTPNALDGETPLMQACARGNLEVVKQLLAAGADPNIACARDGGFFSCARQGKTALGYATIWGSNLEVIAALLDAGADINGEHTTNGMSALMWVNSERCNVEVQHLSVAPLLPPEQQGPIIGECSICMDSIATNSGEFRLGCEHLFHGECIGTWLVGHLTCPNCRADVPNQTRQAAVANL